MATKLNDDIAITIPVFWSLFQYLIRRFIEFYNGVIVMKFDRDIGSTNAYVHVNFQSDAII